MLFQPMTSYVWPGRCSIVFWLFVSTIGLNQVSLWAHVSQITEILPSFWVLQDNKSTDHKMPSVALVALIELYKIIYNFLFGPPTPTDSERKFLCFWFIEPRSRLFSMIQNWIYMLSYCPNPLDTSWTVPDHPGNLKVPVKAQITQISEFLPSFWVLQVN